MKKFLPTSNQVIKLVIMLAIVSALVKVLPIPDQYKNWIRI